MTKHIIHIGQIGLIALASITTPLANAAGNIDPGNKYAWSENAGWINFRPGNGSGGAFIYDDHLDGYVWAENIGWVKLGGSVGGGSPDYYANTSSTNWGVNSDASGNLSGYGWSENVGWINFDSANGGPVTVNTSTGNFDGYAWGENVGWVHFQNTGPDYMVRRDDATLVSLASFEVINENGQITVQWQTGIEIDNAGFNIERRDEPNGEWVKINNTLIPAKGDDSQYSFTDTSAQSGQSYEYRLEDVDLHGYSTYHYPDNTSTVGVWQVWLVEPANGEQLTRETVPTFSWNSDDSHHQFKIQWAYSGGTEIYESPVEGWTLATTFTPSAETWAAFADWVLIEEVTVYWRAAGIDENGNVSHSEVWHFEIGE